MTIQNALTIDVEDYYQVSGFESDISREDWGNYPSRVVASTRRILAILEGHGIKATFFVLGWVADRFPDLVREIDAAGHEVGSHSYWHRLVHELTPGEFRDDLCRSRDLLQEIINKPVAAYRAPSFSITPQSLWALDILAREERVLQIIKDELLAIKEKHASPRLTDFGDDVGEIANVELIANESNSAAGAAYECELFHNNRNGSFTDVAGEQ